MDFKVKLHGIELDFLGKLNEKSQFEETFCELVSCLKCEDTKEIAIQEIFERISRYSHDFFCKMGYVNHTALGIEVTEIMMQRINQKFIQ